MTRILAIAAAAVLTGSAAFADCIGHQPITAAVEIDRTIMTASVTPDGEPRKQDVIVLKKGDRLPEEPQAKQ